MSQTTLDDVFIHFANEQSEEAGLKGVKLNSSTGDNDNPISPVAVVTLPDVVPSSSIETTVV